MKRCIIYARIGGPASEVNNSLMQAQLAGLRTTAKGLGLEVVAELPVFEYGTDGNRQSIKTLARDRRHGLYECVLVKNLSRLARGEAILEVGRKFASAGLSVYTPSGRAELIPPVYAFYSRYRTEGGPAFGSRNKNEDRKQRIRDAFQEGQTVERMPAREDMQPQNSEDVELRVAPYCRVSTMSEMQAESFEIQQQYYSECIAKHPNWVLVRIYADEGISATSVKNRKEFNQMIEDCQAGKIDMIITKSVSRFARNVVDCIKYARMLRSLSPPVSIYFETENINTLSQNGELLLTVLAAFAQDESVNKSISVAWGIRQRFAKGIPKLVKPYGYQLEDNKLIVDEEEAGVVIRIFAFYLGGKTPYEIAKILTSEGIPSPTGKSHWTVSSVTYILGNDRYCGDIIMQKSICVDLFAHKRVRNLGQAERFRVRDAHTPLVSKEDWREVKNRVSMPAREAVILEDITGEGVLAELHPIQFKEDVDI